MKKSEEGEDRISLNGNGESIFFKSCETTRGEGAVATEEDATVFEPPSTANGGGLNDPASMVTVLGTIPGVELESMVTVLGIIGVVMKVCFNVVVVELLFEEI